MEWAGRANAKTDVEENSASEHVDQVATNDTEENSAAEHEELAGNSASEHEELLAIVAADGSGNNEVLKLFEYHKQNPRSECWFCFPLIRGASSICIGCSATICPAHRHSPTGLCIGTEKKGLISCYSKSRASGWTCLSEVKFARLCEWQLTHMDSKV